MMILTQTKTAVAPSITSSFLAIGGVPPYSYAVQPNGAGGSINAQGVYTAPNAMSDDPRMIYDVVQVIDSTGMLATARILVGTPLFLFMEILQRELSIPSERIFLYDQKIFQPTDTGLYVSIGVMSCRPFGNNTNISDTNSFQYTTFQATLEINAMSRDISALTRKEEILMACNSIYAQQQQEANSFFIGKLPPNSGFKNLSNIDGAAIPYRFQININLLYAVSKIESVDYYDTFSTPQVITNP